MMTYRERMLATLRGQPTDCIPCVPRLDLWYKSNKYRGMLPHKYRNATLMEIIDDLEVGYHAVISDRDLYDDYLDIVDRALGIWRVHNMPWRTILRGIKRNISYDGDTTSVEYLTPAGNIRTRVVYNESMRAAGITLTHVLEHPIKTVEDYEAVAYIFEHAEVQPNYEGLARLGEEVGDRGLIVGMASMGSSAMHHIIHELMPYDQFFYHYYDHYNELAKLHERMTPYIDKVLDVTIAAPVDVVYSGTNYDTQITWPPFVAQWVVPYLGATADKTHAAGKFLLTHTDGENKGLLQFFVDAKIDIADSITPWPMTSLTLRQVREAFAGKITIFGGIPSVAMLENSMNDYEFDSFINDLFEQLGRGDHLILSIADTAPPEMKFARLERIIKMAREFGPVNPG